MRSERLEHNLNIIFHCDDLGLTPSISRDILRAWRSGLLTSFSFMANGYASEEAARALKSTPDLPVRIAAHLNLFEGKCLSGTDGCHLIADENKNLNCTVGYLIRKWMFSNENERSRLLLQVENEWREQIRVIQDLIHPRTLGAVDSHCHFHMLPNLFPVAAKLAEEFGINEIRISREPLYISSDWEDSLNLSFATNIVKSAVCRIWANSARKSAAKHNLRSTDSFVGLLYTGRMSAAAAVAGLRASEREKSASVELLFHIGRASDDERQYWLNNPQAGMFPLSKNRNHEYDALRELVEKQKNGKI